MRAKGWFEMLTHPNHFVMSIFAINAISLMKKMTGIKNLCFPLLSIFLYTTLATEASAQNLPFQKSSVIPGFHFGDVLVNEEGDIKGITYTPPYTSTTPKMVFFDVYESSDTFSAIEIYPPQIGSILFSFFDKGEYQHSSINILQNIISSTGPLFIHYDTQNNSVWGKTGSTYTNWGSFTTDIYGNTLLLFTKWNSYGKINLYYLDPEGSTIWEKGIWFSKPELGSFRIKPLDVVFDAETNSFFVLGAFITLNDTQGDRSFILQIHNNGDIGNHIITGAVDFKEIKINGNDLFLIGKAKDSTGITGNDYNAITARFKTDLSSVWTKIFYGEAFEYYRASLQILNNGSIVLGYSTTGFFPAVLANLDTDGNILSLKGYPFFNPEIEVLSNGSLLLASYKQITPEGELSTYMTITQTDSLGQLDNCPIYPACLQNMPYNLYLESFLITLDTADSLIDVELVTEPSALIFQDVCQDIQAPSPFFSIPDTICIGQTIQTEGTENALASKIQWTLLQNDSLIETWEDSTNIQYEFDIAGDYTLRLTIWYLGCSYTYERSIKVLPALEITIEQDGIYCSAPLTLTPSANRPVSTYLWSTGGQSAHITIEQTGVYQLIASDGFCSDTTLTNITFLNELFNEEEAISRPNDTSICPLFFPYQLYVETPTDGLLYINDEFIESWPVDLTAQGYYAISLKIDNCTLRDTFHIDTINCLERIYIPNAFSPNGDGVNDFFQIEGKYFMPTKLLIFNRWGSLIYERTQPPFHWNGQNANSGIYLYLFEYINTLTGEAGRKSGSVLLQK